MQVNLEKTFAHNPHVFSDGKFLVEYYVAHPDDSKYGAINKRYWKEYHAKLGSYQLHKKYHIIKPTICEEKYCVEKSLIPYETWSYIGQENIFIHSPFDFATLNGRKTKDRISEFDWKKLIQSKDEYHNHPPVLTAPRVSLHIDTPIYSSHTSVSISSKIQSYNEAAYLEHR